ncbi:DC1 [Dillenia turbinata]|uniref:DC1 n=1 Tax=Dillenia turbinata TaxID=194707 RepID=A0AAN8YSH3_9MAGN
MENLVEVEGPVIIAMKGDQCTGKTTLAEALARALKWPLYSLEVSHKSLVSIPSCSPGNLRQFYDKIKRPQGDSPQLYVILGAATTQLLLGFSVILDADFSSRQYYLMLQDLADLAKATLVIVECKPLNESIRQSWFWRNNYCLTLKWWDKDEEKNTVDESETIPKIMVDTTSPLDIQDQISEVVKFVISCYRFLKFNLVGDEETEATEKARASQQAEAAVDEKQGFEILQKEAIKGVGAEAFELRHYWHEHKLTFFNELDNDLETNCKSCLQTLNPSEQGFYGCLECRYFLHKSCGEIWLPNYFELDFHLKGHRLALHKSSLTLACNICNHFIREFFYQCDSCGFVTHIKCAFLPSTFDPHCHEHALSLSILHNHEFKCHACGNPGKHAFYRCSGTPDLCTVLFHPQCALLPQTFKHSLSKDPFTLTSCLEVRRDKDEVYCDVCEGKVDREILVYYCLGDDLVSHTTCMISSNDDRNSSNASSYAHKILVEKLQVANKDVECVQEEENELRHCHCHELNYSNEVIDKEAATRCILCSQTIDGSSYTCMTCGFILHKSCAEMRLPYILMFDLHGENHLLNLKKSRGYFKCSVCNDTSDGLFYRCYWCSFVTHVKCAFLPSNLLLVCLEHLLCLSINPHPFPYDSRFRFNCDACGARGDLIFYKCRENCCNITLHVKCALLSQTLERECHTHPLTRSLKFQSGVELEYCSICDRVLDDKQWVYGCEECNLFCHLSCLTKYDYPNNLDAGLELWEYSIYFSKKLLSKYNIINQRVWLDIHFNTTLAKAGPKKQSGQTRWYNIRGDERLSFHKEDQARKDRPPFSVDASCVAFEIFSYPCKGSSYIKSSPGIVLAIALTYLPLGLNFEHDSDSSGSKLYYSTLMENLCEGHIAHG